MRFELTISGLCILALKSSERKPVNPKAVDIIVPAACHHTCRLIWSPEEVTPMVEGDLVLDTDGKKYTSLDMEGKALLLSFGNYPTPNPGFVVHWGNDDKEAPSAPWEETWMDWVPRLETIGFETFAVPEAGTLQRNARARITLPFGTLSSRNILRAKGSDQFTTWKFADGTKQVVANNVAYIVDGPTQFRLEDAAGNTYVSKEIEGPGVVVKMCLSSDMPKVPTNFTEDTETLDHLQHLEVITRLRSETFVAPAVIDSPRTGVHGCDQVLNIYDDPKG